MTTYIFKVVVEPDEDKWSAYCPALLTQGAATWGNTEAEALRHIHEVVHMVVQALMEDGEPIPEDVLVSQEPPHSPEFSGGEVQAHIDSLPK
jgi:predicted RNase H-like HicB family nuclease